MKAAFFLGKKRIEIKEVDRPKAGPSDAVVRVGACGICGTDLWLYDIWPDVPSGFVPPSLSKQDLLKIIPGHETSGTIVEVGGSVEGFRVGDKVAVNALAFCGECTNCRTGADICGKAGAFGTSRNGGYAEYIKVPQTNLLKLPRDLSVEDGNLLLDAIGVPNRAVRKAGVQKEDTAAVYGCGNMGLSMIQILHLHGVKHIFAIDVVDQKLDFAREMGATAVVNAREENPVKVIKSLTNGEGTSLAFEITGKREAELNALETVRNGGKVVLIGENWKDIEVCPSRHFLWGGITLMGSVAYNYNPWFGYVEFKENLNLLLQARDKFSKINSHSFPLDRISEAFQLFSEGKTRRVLIKP